MKRINKNWLVALGSVIAVSGCVEIGSLVANMLTSKTDDLSKISMIVNSSRNMLPKEAKVTGYKYDDKKFPLKGGEDFLIVQNMKRDGIGMYEIDGKVAVNGSSAHYAGAGVYIKILDKDSNDANKVYINTKSKQQLNLSIKPVPSIKVTSINGGTNVIDVNKPITIEMDNPPGSEGTMVSLKLMFASMGVRAFEESAVKFKSTDKVVIPAGALKHHINPLKFETGNTFIQLERYRVGKVQHDPVGALLPIATALDTVKVNIKDNFDLIKELTIKGEVETGGDKSFWSKRKLKFHVYKPNAYSGRPVELNGKKFALVSLNVNATHLKQKKTSTSSSTSGNVKTTTTTTRTRQFPNLPDAFWESLMNDVFLNAKSLVEKDMGGKLIKTEKVFNAPAYKNLEEVEDEHSDYAVAKTYKGLKRLSPTGFMNIIGAASSTFGLDRPAVQLMDELGVDGLITVSLNLTMPWEEFSLSPSYSMSVIGRPSGYKIGPTTYFTASVSGDGKPWDDAKKESGYNLKVLNKVVQLDQISKTMSMQIASLKAAEKKNGYDAIWKLKP